MCFFFPKGKIPRKVSKYCFTLKCGSQQTALSLSETPYEWIDTIIASSLHQYEHMHDSTCKGIYTVRTRGENFL